MRLFTLSLICIAMCACYPERDADPEPTPAPQPPPTDPDGGMPPITTTDAGQSTPTLDAGLPTPSPTTDAGLPVTSDGGIATPPTADAGQNTTSPDAGVIDPCGQQQLEDSFSWPLDRTYRRHHYSHRRRLSTPSRPMISWWPKRLRNNPMRWVKFSILWPTPARLFSNGNNYPFHYDFAKEYPPIYRNESSSVW